MNVPVLIDAIVRQTTVLIAQLATSGGVRAPLAHVANQVFLDLAAELEAQGVGRKVSADMFGMALRAYLRKLQRLRESSTEQGRSLWSAVLEFLRSNGVVSRHEIMQRFHRDDEAQVKSVLFDLTESGLTFRSGSGLATTYRAASDEELGAIQKLGSASPDEIVWLVVYREGPLSRADLESRVRIDAATLTAAIERLSALGRISRTMRGDVEVLSSSEFVVPLGSPVGWEAAVLDHYQAVVRTVCRRLLEEPGEQPDVNGGSTYTYDVWPGHPLEQEVYAGLRDLRARAGELRQRVEAYNAAHPMPDDHVEVLFYGGQCAIAQTLHPETEEKD